MNEAEQRIAEYERRMRELVENDPLFSILCSSTSMLTVARTVANSCVWLIVTDASNLGKLFLLFVTSDLLGWSHTITV
jgi:hypothetical protein